MGARSVHPNPWCETCNAYLERRRDVLPSHIAAAANRRRIDAIALLVAYARAVHARHLAGLSLDTG